jgi:hypothetical protein
MKSKSMKFTALLLAVFLVLGSTGSALAAGVDTPKPVAPGTTTFTYTLDFDPITIPYASAQFDITIDNNQESGLDIDNNSIVLTSSLGSGVSAVISEKTVDGFQIRYQAGFLSTENRFQNYAVQPVCTVTFRYLGSTPATVRFDNLKVWRLVNTVDGVKLEQSVVSGWSRTVSVSRGTEIPPGGTGNTVPDAGGTGSGGSGVLGATTIDFEDVQPGDWYYSAVQYVAAAKLIAGTTPTTFEPNTPLTRGMFATILYRLAGSPAVVGNNPFSDVTSGQWYTDAVIWASASGVVNGYTSSTFGPNDVLTREQLVTMLYRYASFKGYSVTAGQTGQLSGMTDSGKVSSFAVTAFKWAYASNIIHGTTPTTLSPLGNASRAEGAKIMMDFMESFISRI